MRVLWPHNFDPDVDNSGSFMHIMEAGLRDLGVDLELLYLGDLRSPKEVWQARSSIANAAHNYDLVHAQFGSACAFVTCAARDAMKVVSLRGSDWYRFKEALDFQALHGAVATFVTRVALKHFQAVVAMSERMRGEILGRYPRAMVAAIPDPLNLDHFRPIDRRAARTALGFPGNNERWILFTSLLNSNPIKRPDLAREAVKRANDRLGNIRLRTAQGIKHDQMPVFVGSCDLILSTSTHEGWPNCVKEALACNIPFVATDVSDLGMIAAQERSCHVCPPDPDALADKICESLTMPAPGNLRRHVAGMDVSLTSRRLLDFYDSVLSHCRT